MKLFLAGMSLGLIGGFLIGFFASHLLVWLFLAVGVGIMFLAARFRRRQRVAAKAAANR